jgi:hypothetical protein
MVKNLKILEAKNEIAGHPNTENHLAASGSCEAESQMA